MRSSSAPLLAAVLAALAAGPAHATDDCLSPAEMREVVAGREVVAPLQAVRAARGLAPRSEVLRAVLCPNEKGMIYLITLLDGQGRIMQVTVEAASGKVMSPQ